MAVVFIPPQLRSVTGAAQVEVGGETVREVIAELEENFPGMGARLLNGDQLAPTLQLSVAHVMTRVLSTRVEPDTEIHFLPIIGGG